MGILQKVFRKRRPLATGMAGMRPDSPVEVELDEHGAPITTVDRSPRSRAELIEELKKNYAEVLEFVRKVDTHLDEQRERGEKLLAITRGVPDALDAVPALRSQADAIARGIERMVEIAKSSDEHSAAAVNELIALGERLKAIDERGEHVATTIGEFRESVHAIARSGERLNQTMDALHRENSLREDRLMSILERQQRWLIVALSLCGVGVALALIVTIIALAT